MRWRCSVCGDEHDGLPLDWSYDKPAYWEGPRNDDDFLTSDLCSWTDDDGKRAYFIRGLLHVPVPELDDTLVAAAGFPDLAARPPDHVAASPGVSVRFGVPRPWRRPRLRAS